jgi:inorganic phosphate transporter, PiT family
VSYYVANGIGGSAGVAITFVALLVAATAFFAGSRKTKVTSSNVNDEWTGTVAPAQNSSLAAVAA